MAKFAHGQVLSHHLYRSSHVYFFESIIFKILIEVRKEAKRSMPRKTQRQFNSNKIMFQFHSKAIKFIEEHVWAHNPKKTTGKRRSADENQPFFMYLSFRAPHKEMMIFYIACRKELSTNYQNFFFIFSSLKALF